MTVRGLWLLFVSMPFLVGCTASLPQGASREASLEEAEAKTKFSYKGQSIPPFFLADFCGGPDANDIWTSGMGQRVVAVSVPGLFHSTSYDATKVKEGDFIFFRRLSTDGRLEVEMGYRFVGTSQSGISVIEYFGNTGGSGTVHGIVFVRFNTATLGITKREQRNVLLMQFIGEQTWGDRVRRTVSLRGNVLLLGATRADIPEAKAQKECVIVLQ